MAATESTMLELGTPAPRFTLPNMNPNAGPETISLETYENAPCLVVMFICNHCPYVKHLQSALQQFADDFQPKGVAIVAINSNDVEAYPDDSPDRMAELCEQLGWSFPYCFDETQEVAKRFRAACTPDFYVFMHGEELIYRGQFDDTRPRGGQTPTGRDLRDAVTAVLRGDPVSNKQRPSIGCNIKWKSGNAPEYAAG